MNVCTHTWAERDEKMTFDGMCPICLKEAGNRLVAAAEGMVRGTLDKELVNDAIHNWRLVVAEELN